MKHRIIAWIAVFGVAISLAGCKMNTGAPAPSDTMQSGSGSGSGGY